MDLRNKLALSPGRQGQDNLWAIKSWERGREIGEQVKVQLLPSHNNSHHGLVPDPPLFVSMIKNAV